MAEFVLQQSQAFIERQVITAMVISDRALRVLGLSYKPRYLSATFAQTVAKWCLEYQDRYSRAPGPDIQVLFESHRRSGLNEDEARLIGQFLQGLSQEFEKGSGWNEQLAIDEAMKYFRERSLALLRDDLDHHLAGGNVNQAQAAVADFVAPANHVAMGFEPLEDLDRMRAAFESRQGLFTLPGDLGKMINSLERDNSVAVVGKFKATKSFTSQYIGLQALYSGLNVAWFDFEMGEVRIDRRIAQAICAMPLSPPNNGRVLAPVWDCKLNQDGSCTRPERIARVHLFNGDGGKPKFSEAPYGYRPCNACPGRQMETWLMEREVGLLDWRTAWHKGQTIIRSVMGARLKVQSWPKFSAGFDDVKAALQVWRHLEGFMPDIVIVDQPSGMKMTGKGDIRHQIDELWKRLCALPQELHCLGIYPSQAGGKAAQERRRLRDSDVAEHAGILGHVDATIKIDHDDVPENQDDPQRAWFSMGVERDDRSPARYCCVLQCLDLGQPVLDSRFK